MTEERWYIGKNGFPTHINREATTTDVYFESYEECHKHMFDSMVSDFHNFLSYNSHQEGKMIFRESDLSELLNTIYDAIYPENKE